MREPGIGGRVAPGWEEVREVFVRNFAPTAGDPDDPGDLGAGLHVIRDGRVVVDLWGGWRDRARTVEFSPDTLVNVYSVGKGITATVALAAVARGTVDLDGPARRWWPALGLDTTLRHHLTHQAGVPALRDPVDDDLPLDWDRMCAALAATEPWWEPGTAHGYHTNTAGHLVGEPVRRAAGAARFGDVVHDWVARPAEADVWLGVPGPALARCSDIDFPGGSSPTAGIATGELRDDRQRMLHHAYFNPPTLSGTGIVESEAWRRAEIPSTNLHATAAGVARIYASLLDPDGPVPRSLLTEAATTQVDGHDLVLGKRSRFGLGFQLHQDDRPIGVGPGSFGHYGFGGSLGFADPDAGLAVGYVLNRPGDRWQIPRTRRLLEALATVTARSS